MKQKSKPQYKYTGEINLDELVVGTFNSGKSPWAVNPVCGIQVTHIPTGLTFKSEKERSQHRNKVICMNNLKLALEEYK